MIANAQYLAKALNGVNNMTFFQPHQTLSPSSFPKYVAQDTHGNKKCRSNAYNFCTSLS